MLTDSWLDWQRQVVYVIRSDFGELLPDIGAEDIDWDAWRPLYEDGCSAKAAVDQAFVREASYA